MAGESPPRVGTSWKTGISVGLAAAAVFIVVYPALLFLIGIHIVTLVYDLVPAAGSAVFVAGLVVDREYSLRQLWTFAVAFVSIAAFGLVAYRFVVEPYFFGGGYEIHFVFDRFSHGVWIGVLAVITILAYAIAK